MTIEPTDNPTLESSPPKKRYGVLDWIWILGTQLSWITWFLASNSFFEGFLTTLLGLIYLETLSVALLCCTILILRKNRLWQKYRPWHLLAFFNLFLISQHFSITPFDTHEKEDIAVMTWNIQGLATLEKKNSCVIDSINAWKKDKERFVITLQEVPPNKTSYLEEKLGLTCQSLTKLGKNILVGSMVCADASWKSKKIPTAPLDDGGYRYLFVELSDSNGHRINILNMHLQSIAKVKVENKPKSIFGYVHLFTVQNQEHQQAIQKIIDKLQPSLKDPSLITGDFNTPPTVPIHRHIRRNGLTDAHLERGNGFGFTKSEISYHQYHVPKYARIDYLYATKHLEWTGKTITHTDIDCSDHHPVSGWIKGERLE